MLSDSRSDAHFLPCAIRTHRSTARPSRSQEAVDRLGRRLDDGLILIKGRVQQHGHACHFLELVNQLPIPRIHVALHCLDRSLHSGRKLS